MFHPIYKANSLVLGNPDSPVGVVTLWTLRKKVAERLDPQHYAAIGQLYSPTQGIDYLVRNLLANPSIRFVALTGHDLSGSGQALRAFFEKGFDAGKTSLGAPCWRIRCDLESFVDSEIDGEALERLRANVRLVVCEDQAALTGVVAELGSQRPGPYAEPALFEKREPEAQTAVGENAAYVVRGQTVAETWIQLLQVIWNFGRIGQTHYDSRQKEVLDLVSIVSSEDPDSLFVPDYLPCTPELLERYFPTVLTAEMPSGNGKGQGEIRYTYGQRLRSYFGVDQIGDVIAKLVRERDSRSAAASLWDPTRDHKIGGSPCLNHLWFRIVEDRLNLTSVIRSNDMYKAWPENAFALRRLQEIVRQSVETASGEKVGLGELIIVSESAHIYDDDWDATEHVLARHYPELAARLRERRDPRGNFVVEIEPDGLRVERISGSGEHVKNYYGKTAAALVRQITHDLAVSQVEHALYLGGELQKAELAYRFPEQFRYVQDRSLETRAEVAPEG